MRFVIQRVSRASVRADGKICGSIQKGFAVLIGISGTDTTSTADRMISKMLGLRIFPDEEGKTNLSLEDAGGSLLLISQFTLYADCRKGNRPSFTKAGPAKHAGELYEYIVKKCKEAAGDVQSGVFGASMKVELVNEGPFTIILDSDELSAGRGA